MPKYFTRDEAEALLPRVESLLREIQILREQVVELEERLAELRVKLMSNGHQRGDEMQRMQASLMSASAEITRRVRNIAALGVLVKDLDTGLIDFPTLRDGREVYLCWRLGEGSRIAWWHEVDSGFAGRQRLEND
ncbi:MAG TPA: DUF2203 domain-containing protein [Ktedonobacterales bacterium]